MTQWSNKVARPPESKADEAKASAGVHPSPTVVQRLLHRDRAGLTPAESCSSEEFSAVLDQLGEPSDAGYATTLSLFGTGEQLPDGLVLRTFATLWPDALTNDDREPITELAGVRAFISAMRRVPRVYMEYPQIRFVAEGSSSYDPEKETIILEQRPGPDTENRAVRPDGKKRNCGTGLACRGEHSALHELSHNAGFHVKVGRFQMTGNQFCRVYGRWERVDSDAVLAAYAHNWSGELPVNIRGARISLPVASLARWIINLLSGAGRTLPPELREFGEFGEFDVLAAVQTSMRSSGADIPLWNYFSAVLEAANLDISRLPETAYCFPSFHSPQSRTFMYSTRADPAGWWSYDSVLRDMLPDTHGWYCLSSFEECFAEFGAQKWLGGPFAAPQNGLDPQAFFSALDAQMAAAQKTGDPDHPAPQEEAAAGPALFDSPANAAGARKEAAPEPPLAHPVATAAQPGVADALADLDRTLADLEAVIASL